VSDGKADADATGEKGAWRSIGLTPFCDLRMRCCDFSFIPHYKRYDRPGHRDSLSLRGIRSLHKRKSLPIVEIIGADNDTAKTPNRITHRKGMSQLLTCKVSHLQHFSKLTRSASAMLVLSRHRDESIMIGDNIVITIVDIRGDKVRLGIQAPSSVPVHREEIYKAIQREASATTLDAAKVAHS